ADASVLDFEVNPTFTLSVEVNDGELADEATITINLSDINESPLIAAETFVINENSAAGTAVGTVHASDPEEDDLTYSIVSGNDLGAFQVDANTGELSVAEASILDFENNPTFELSVKVSDGELTDEGTITINLIGINEAPLVGDQSFNVDENSPTETVVGTIAASDPEGDDLTFSITSGNDLGAFQVDANTGELSVTQASLFNFEVNPSFSLKLEVSDGELSDKATIIVNLNDQNESPIITPANYTIDENSSIGTLVGTVDGSDPDGDILSFTIFSRDDFGAFQLDHNTGELVVVDSNPLDFESNEHFELHISVSDGQTTDQAVIGIELGDINERPTDIFISSSTIMENVAIGQQIGVLTTEDEDLNDAFAYKVKDGAELFKLNQDGLLSNETFDFEQSGSQIVEITSTDRGGLSFSKVFEITIIDVAEIILKAPTIELEIYPNPTSEYLYIKGVDFRTVKIFDLTGKVVITSDAPMINVRELPNGVYTLLIDGKHLFKTRFVKK
ncbi:MAG: cadherin domain-containing protein, partial [Marinoscillum sp.]